MTETQRIGSNILLELKDDLTYSLEKLEKKFKVERKPKVSSECIFQEEINESSDAVNSAIDLGQKFISDH